MHSGHSVGWKGQKARAVREQPWKKTCSEGGARERGGLSGDGHVRSSAAGMHLLSSAPCRLTMVPLASSPSII